MSPSVRVVQLEWAGTQNDFLKGQIERGKRRRRRCRREDEYHFEFTAKSRLKTVISSPVEAADTA